MLALTKVCSTFKLSRYARDDFEGIYMYAIVAESVLRRLSNGEQHTKFCIDSILRSCRDDLHVVIAMGYTALYKSTRPLYCQPSYMHVRP